MANSLTGNRGAFLDSIAVSELGKQLIALSDNGYNVKVGSTPSHPLLFDSYSDHPRVLNVAMRSTAAGRYQLLARYFDSYKALLGLPDFGPASQDAIAIQQIRERHALPLIDGGDFDAAVTKVNNIWASLPGAKYGQHTNTIEFMRQAYIEAGGILA